MIVCGIDPSLSGTAVVFGGWTPEEDGVQDGTRYTAQRFPSKSRGRLVVPRTMRILELSVRVADLVAEANPELIIIEGYSFGSQNAGEYLGEYGGLLRAKLIDITHAVYEVAPTTLKKFATGKGNTKKDVMCAAIAKRWDVLFDSSDEYDAYAMWRMALMATAQDTDWTKPQLEALKKALPDFKPGEPLKNMMLPF